MSFIRNSLLALGICAGAQAAEGPAISLEGALPDWNKTIEHWESSPYHTIWTTLQESEIGPQLATMLQEASARSKEEIGFDIFNAIRDFEKAGAILSGNFESDSPDVTAEIAMKTMIEPIWANLISNSPNGKIEADGSLALEDGAVANKVGQAIHINKNGFQQAALDAVYSKAQAHDSYFHSRIDTTQIPDKKNDGAAAKQWFALKQVTEVIVQGHGLISAEGIQTQIDISGLPNTVSQALDAPLIQALPAETIGVLALGINGPGILALQDEIASVNPEAAVEFEQMDANLQMMGIPNRQALLESLQGTLMIAITPGMMVPGISLSLPANDAIDTLMNVTAMQGGADLSTARTAAVMINLPNMNQPVYAFRSESAWVLSTDPAIVDPIANKTPGTFNQGAIGTKINDQLAANHLTLSFDTQSVMQMAMQYLPMAGMFAPPEAQPLIIKAQNIIPQIIPHLKPSILLGTQDSDGMHLSAENDFVLSALQSALVLPLVGAARNKATKWEESQAIEAAPIEPAAEEEAQADPNF